METCERDRETARETASSHTGAPTPASTEYALPRQQAPGEPRSGAAVLIETLVRCGVDTVFGYPGGAVLPLYDALHADGRLRHVLVRHEQAAVHAAEGYARSSGRVGVVFVTSGPGVANTVSGLLDAMADSVPVLCISGQVATSSIGTDAFQECDAMGITRPVTKWSRQIRNVGEIACLCEKALRVAASGRPGPVLLDFPKDMQAAMTVLHENSSDTHDLHRYTASQKPAHKGSIMEALALIRAAKRPVFYGGGGLVISGDEACAAFASLVRETGAPCTLTLMGLGAFPASDAHFLGMLGMHGSVEANLAMHHADLVVCVGARFDDRVTGKLDGFCPNAKFVHIDIDPTSINKVVKADVPIVADCLDALIALRQALAANGGVHRARLNSWWRLIGKWRALRSFHVLPRRDEILPQVLLQTLAARLNGLDAFITTDVGQHQMWAAQHLPIELPRRFISSGGAGTMGFGLPAAIGAKIAHPGKPVICISGDASVLMNIQELSSAKQHECDVKLIISNNGYMGMVRQWQELNYGGRYSHSYTDALPDFVALAHAFGWQAAKANDPASLDAAIDACMNTSGPYLLDVRVAAQANCFPMVPAGMAHHQIMLSEQRWYGP
ncbi:biosynthetic-type acetolactate synthase large subunit [Paraburkholderia sp. ZP32-5]|uniref:biosynthetic-type acetolactate synthase large subunit n=1 Tax=Paraburkholderia sp. ZP32-5 TaxID=2883245 RepID=UPI001F322A54|nr:biosynthetic-type acetolactate synthase large subunit [Paraburkholderia sp. ZP32-5]